MIFMHMCISIPIRVMRRSLIVCCSLTLSSCKRLGLRLWLFTAKLAEIASRVLRGTYRRLHKERFQ